MEETKPFTVANIEAAGEKILQTTASLLLDEEEANKGSEEAVQYYLLAVFAMEQAYRHMKLAALAQKREDTNVEYEIGYAFDFR